MVGPGGPFAGCWVSECLLKGPCSSPSGSCPRELRERLKPELLELIRQQRLLRLCEGTLFRKISSRRRQGECQPRPAPGQGTGTEEYRVPPSLPQERSQLTAATSALSKVLIEGAAPSPRGVGWQLGAERFPTASLLQISCGTAACHPTTRCCTTGTWRRGCNLPPSRACPRKVGDEEKEREGEW